MIRVGSLAAVLALWAAGGVPAFAAPPLVTAEPDSSFQPITVTIVVGGSVRFQNNGGTHNVVADDASFRCAAGCDDAGGDGDPATTAWSFERFFSSAGTLGFFCEIHGSSGGGGMSGTIVVLPSAIFSGNFESGTTAGWSVVAAGP